MVVNMGGRLELQIRALLNFYALLILLKVKLIGHRYHTAKKIRLIYLKTGPFGSSLHKSDYIENGVPVINPMHINSGRIVPTNEMTVSEEKADALREYILQKGDIVFARRGVMGRCAVVREEEQGWLCGSGSMIIRVNNRILPDYLQIVLSSPDIVNALEANAVGSTMTNLNQKILLNLIIPIPNIPIQRAIVNQSNTLLAHTNSLGNQLQSTLAKVERLISSTLKKAFLGQLCSQNIGDEPAAVLLKKIKAQRVQLEAERKAQRTIRRSVKKTNRVSMATPTDYLESLSSTFVKSGEIDIRKLFDQAGFRPEEVIEFYEALRVSPEVRSAFEEVRQALPSQEEQLEIQITDETASENGRFRLIYLWLEEFKNLVDYTVRFDDSHSIDIVLGWNGTGKSNLFESLVVIFRDLHDWSNGKTWDKNSIKGFCLRYEIREQIVEITWHPEEMRSPLLKVGTFQEGLEEIKEFKKIAKSKLPLPRFVFGYYSGPTNRLAGHFLPMNQRHYNRLRDATSDDPKTLSNLLEERKFFCAENHHAKYVLLAFFHKEDPAISEFLEKRLRIVGFESALFVIRKPRWAKSGAKADDFWGARGVMRRVLERLRRFSIAPMVVAQNVREGYSSQNEDHYYFFLPDLRSLHAFAAEYQDARTFFLALESIDFSELIYDLKIQVKVQATKTEQVAITFHELSEGEQQLLMVLGLMRFTKSHQSLILLDEPDTHLNPHWSVDYLKLLSSVMSEVPGDESEEQKTSQILMSTHDPLVIASLLKEQIHLLKRDWQTDACIWEQPTVNPRGLGFTGILTSEMFGMRSDLDEETLTDLDNKVRLVAQEGSLTPEEAEELEEINKRLEHAGFEKAFSDPYYAAFVRAWGQRYKDLMAGTRFINSEQKEEIDRISREVLEEVLAELQAEATN
ncbi:AAA family ATPase [Sphaerothrix gracilis]|uniref:AAA family ATPase n=1 Tax=Sphaerothrix gracilis TaxID=3151835 RepID=UPI0031FD71C2